MSSDGRSGDVSILGYHCIRERDYVCKRKLSDGRHNKYL